MVVGCPHILCALVWTITFHKLQRRPGTTQFKLFFRFFRVAIVNKNMCKTESGGDYDDDDDLLLLVIRTFAEPAHVVKSFNKEISFVTSPGTRHT